MGLGYVGLPLSLTFARKFPVIGFDIKMDRVEALKNHIDVTGEVERQELELSSNLKFTSKLEDLASCNFFVVTVPTPVDDQNVPDLGSLRAASEVVAKVIKVGDFVVYESTVYPGVTEEVCIPIVEQNSGLKLNEDFFCGYSPERINPGDKTNKLEDIVKVTSGSNYAAANFIDAVYSSIISAGTYKAKSIKVAEAAKVVENTQRDLNIALMNELAVIFGKLNLNTKDVIEAASTKWNFHAYAPGLVGGHCIGVDPYYLTYRSMQEGHIPDVILAGRKINDNMPVYIAERLLERLALDAPLRPGLKCLVLGFTFKEDCSDVRNTKVLKMTECIARAGLSVDVYDPFLSDEFVFPNGARGVSLLEPGRYDAIVIAVPHAIFKQWGIDKIKAYGTSESIVFDIKSIFPRNSVDIQL